MMTEITANAELSKEQANQAQPASDLEGQLNQKPDSSDENPSPFKSLGWLDRFLAVWIFIAMLIGILLGNFVPSTGPALEKGKFVGVSVPIGKFNTFGIPNHVPIRLKNKSNFCDFCSALLTASHTCSCWSTRHDVSDSVQSQVRVPPQDPVAASHVEADTV